MPKQFFVYDPGEGSSFVEFDTEEEAIAYAKQAVEAYREQGRYDGEWCDEVAGIKVGRFTHTVHESIVDDEIGAVDYEIAPVS